MTQAPIGEIVLEPGRSEAQYWRDLWRYRELFYFLAWRDLMVRYKQTFVGVAWALIRPLLTMIILTVIFGSLAGMDAGGDVPYPILVLCGMLPWQFFSTAMSAAGQSLVNNAGMVSKVYFPRLVVPASSVITSLVDFFISAALLVAMMIYYQYVPSLRVVLLPAFMGLAFAAAFGVGVWVAALMVRYRDFRFIVPFVVQFGLYISPVGFQSGVVPEHLRLAYSINPMVGVIDGVRWSVIGDAVAPDAMTFIAAGVDEPVAVPFAVSVEGRHDAPDGPGLTIADASEGNAITPISLGEAGADTGVSSFFLRAPPRFGRVTVDGEAIGRGGHFTRGDLIAGRVAYDHQGGGHELYLPGLAISLVLVALINLLGIRFFRKTEKTFADVI